ncbi:hypothetical protein CRE_19552 [Caenorhabditis remanei]|uniref:Uncharacterized protein n=1 Tax=Caenorhabditis remanei TaxID=31234 RepID=E3NLG0_CAERE|nr:hypothetical protein CRE_19552 [Caenorhabditis remanei]
MEKWVHRREIESLASERFVFKRGHNLLDGVETVLLKKELKPVSDKGFFSTTGQMIPFGLLPENSILIHDYHY